MPHRAARPRSSGEVRPETRSPEIRSRTAGRVWVSSGPAFGAQESVDAVVAPAPLPEGPGDFRVVASPPFHAGQAGRRSEPGPPPERQGPGARGRVTATGPG